jgi:hypothetical protein
MTKNLGAIDRTLRVLAAVGLGVCALAGPFSWGIRLGIFGLNAAYLLWSALAGSCLGYRMLGKSTCPTTSHS